MDHLPKVDQEFKASRHIDFDPTHPESGIIEADETFFLESLQRATTLAASASSARRSQRDAWHWPRSDTGAGSP